MKFSIDELVDYDLPAIISYVKRVTNSKKLSYVGHSQGSIIMFGLLAMKPKEYAEIIDPFVALDPFMYMDPIQQASVSFITPVADFLLRSLPMEVFSSRYN